MKKVLKMTRMTGLSLALFVGVGINGLAQEKSGQAVETPKLLDGQWSVEKANNWYAGQRWIVGCNFLPSTAVNDVEMWQNETFDLPTIDKELGFAKEWGINSVRVFLNYVVWEAEAKKLKTNFKKFLDAAEKHGIGVTPILFDDCNFSGNVAKVGKQQEPVPGVHNSGWVASPPAAMIQDEAQWKKLKAYEQDMIKTFGKDKRIIMWDLYNEPGAGDSKIKAELLEKIFAWAREAQPNQPLTVGAFGDWDGELSKLMRSSSDIVSFHSYGDKADVENKIQWAHGTERPAVCTEWLRRQAGNTVQDILPLFLENKIGCYSWGLVEGRTQTYFHWGSEKDSPKPAIWQHDLIREDGTPYSLPEYQLFREMRHITDMLQQNPRRMTEKSNQRHDAAGWLNGAGNIPSDAISHTAIGEQAKAIIGRHVIRFTKPGERIPSQVSVYAPLLGNGFTGIALSGNPERQVFYAARNDFWKLKHAHNESYPAVLGKIALSIPQLEGASFLIEQRLYDATTKARFEKDSFAVEYEAYVAATDDMLFVEISMEGGGTLEGSIRLDLPGEKELHSHPPVETAPSGKLEISATEQGVQHLSRAFDNSVDIPTKAAMALRVEGSPDGRFTLKQGQPVRFVCAFSSNFKSKDCTAAAIRKAAEYSPAQQRETEEQHRQWWKTYWEKSFVSIPDSIVERQYYVSLYGTASCSRDTDFPPGLFGTWITAEQPAWASDYHLNYNHMAPFYALYSANRIEQAEPYYRPLLALIPRGQYYSKKILGIDDGILLPVGIGPLGIETTRQTPLMEKYRTWWRTTGNIEDEGMFWKQRSNAAYCVVNLAMQLYRTWDRAFVERVYPFVRHTAIFWEKYLKYEDGRYVDYHDAIHEGTDDPKNPLLSLGLIKRVMQTAVDMSVLVGADANKREKWLHIRDHISPYPTYERNGKTVFRYTEVGTEWVDGNTLGIQHIYPGEVIGLDSDPELLGVARNTIDVMQRWLDSNGSNSFFPAAVRVGYSPDVIMQQLRRYTEHACPNGFQLDNPHGIENFSTVPNTVNEMLCMGHQDVVRLFPVWNRSHDASFHQIRVEGAFLVSAALKSGEVTSLSVYSEQGRPLCLLNPWKGRRVSVAEWTNGKKTAKKTYAGERILLPTKPNVTYVFSSL